jgi:hypothetical protein
MAMRTYDLGIPDGRRSFISDYWLHFAGYAYGQYLENGRGAVLLSGSTMDENEMLFIPLSQLGNYPDIVNSVEKYNPEFQIVVVMALPGLLAVHAQKGDPSPPEAYRFVSRGAKK